VNRYRKKPIIIEAFQMTEDRRYDNGEWPDWLNRAWQLKIGTPGAMQLVDKTGQDTDAIELVTLEGSHRVSWGDWIIQGVKGELYPCKPDIFDATYEAVE
jgi:hypothetical protein